MRKLLISILLASAAASPALADPGDHNDRHAAKAEARAERQQAREESHVQVQPERPQFTGNPHVDRSSGGGQQPFVYRQQVQGDQHGGWDRSRFQGHGGDAPQQVEQVQVDRHSGWDRSRFERRGNDAPQQVEQTERSSGWSRDRGSWSQNRDGDFRQREATQQQYRDRNRWASGGWNRDWRNDRQYDWRRYRDHHRSTFHLGVYFDPFGYGYRSFDVGYQLYQGYYAQQYWINDPWDYQLPPPAPGTVWVRYFNDALLVDMYSGEVVDAIHGFFW